MYEYNRGSETTMRYMGTGSRKIHEFTKNNRKGNMKGGLLPNMRKSKKNPSSSMAAVLKALHSCLRKMTGAAQKSVSVVNMRMFDKCMQCEIS